MDMELIALLKDFGLPGIFIGIMVYIVKYQEQSNLDREARFTEERKGWQARDIEWVARLTVVLQANAEVLTKFAVAFERLERELILLHSSNAQTQTAMVGHLTQELAALRKPEPGRTEV